ncbi:MAG: GDP-mannose 4,6-dehydratase, partial [bacterium]
DPSTPYAASKAAGDMMIETLVKNFDFPAVTIRATNVYGAHQQLHKIIPRSAIYLETDRTIELHGGGEAIKSYIHIRDVSRGELAAMETGTPGEIYHLSPDDGISIRDLVKTICRMMGEDFDERTRDVGERLGQDKAYVIDSSKARSQFDWKPEIELETGLQGVIDWVRDNLEIIQQKPLEYQHRE